MKLHCLNKINPNIIVGYYTLLIYLVFDTESIMGKILIFISNIFLVINLGCKDKLLSYNRFFMHFAIIMTIFNLLLYPPGNTVILQIFDIRITLEVINKSFCNILNFFSSIILFISFNKILSSNKLLYVLGKFSPSIAILINMSIKYIDVIKKRVAEINSTTVLPESKKKKFYTKLKKICNTIFFVSTWCLNDSIEINRVLKLKNFNPQKRSNYFFYEISPIDLAFLFFYLISFTFIIILKKFIKTKIYYAFMPLILFLSLPFAFEIFFIMRHKIRKKES